MAGFNPKEYAEVKDRIKEFHVENPEGSIKTFIAHLDGPVAIVEARLFRTRQDVIDNVYTSGFAREVEGKSNVNKTSHLENAETSAIGRALANLAYMANANRASREEMLKVERMQIEHDKLIEFVQTYAKKASDEVKARIKTEWKDAEEQFAVARGLVDAIEKDLGVTFA